MPKGNCVTEADSDYCVKVEILVRALFEDCRKKKQGNVIKGSLGCSEITSFSAHQRSGLACVSDVFLCSLCINDDHTSG